MVYNLTFPANDIYSLRLRQLTRQICVRCHILCFETNIHRKLPKYVALRVKFFKVSLKVSNRTIFRNFYILRHVSRNIFSYEFQLICLSFSLRNIRMTNMPFVIDSIFVLALRQRQSYIHSNTMYEPCSGRRVHVDIIVQY